MHLLLFFIPSPIEECPVHGNIDRGQRDTYPGKLPECQGRPLLFSILYDYHVTGCPQDGEVPGDGASRRQRH